LLLRPSTVRNVLAALPKRVCQPKDAERRDKKSVGAGRDTERGQSP
jgi:hypothetical protein